MARRVAKWHHTGVPLRDAGVVRVRVARFTLAEAAEFRREYEAVRERASVRQLAMRTEEELEQRPLERPRTVEEQAVADALDALHAAGVVAPDASGGAPSVWEALRAAVARWVETAPAGDAWVVSDDEVRSRRMAEMSPAQREAFDALVAEEDAREIKFLSHAITAHVVVEPGQIEIEHADGRVEPLTTGEQLLEYFGADLNGLRAMAAVIQIENSLSEDRKKLWRSLLPSSDSSTASAAPATPGIAPLTADAVALPASAADAAATETPEI